MYPDSKPNKTLLVEKHFLILAELLIFNPGWYHINSMHVEVEGLFEKSHFEKESTQTVRVCATIMHFLL
jgi:hypothetical protein